MPCIAAPVNATPAPITKNADGSLFVCTKCNISKEFKLLPASGSVPAHYFCPICGKVYILGVDLPGYH